MKYTYSSPHQVRQWTDSTREDMVDTYFFPFTPSDCYYRDQAGWYHMGHWQRSDWPCCPCWWINRVLCAVSDIPRERGVRESGSDRHPNRRWGDRTYYILMHSELLGNTRLPSLRETRNCKGPHTINAANVGSTRDLISQKNVWRQTIDCKTDTTWKTFRDTNMTRTDKVGSQQWTAVSPFSGLVSTV